MIYIWTQTQFSQVQQQDEDTLWKTASGPWEQLTALTLWLNSKPCPWSRYWPQFTHVDMSVNTQTKKKDTVSQRCILLLLHFNGFFLSYLNCFYQFRDKKKKKMWKVKRTAAKNRVNKTRTREQNGEHHKKKKQAFQKMICADPPAQLQRWGQQFNTV